ncbi:cytochrome c biogenesis CcdA family protein [Natronoglycomyces albus]|uniref:Cytochrome c biogenesis protein CcdA n=1 Tax=Natronoglycomyces albus TaxID=2811108 RepID=A0A895XI79_9ACTN|nr:cytochrome c biogenesis protein CcdA [Natronoglycomyces albus]QSB05044.1 cytochrome c biogenesis protein CcdA [Natronoglycomyces albus]
MTGVEELANNGPLLAAMGVAALAGLLSFFTPCTLPLVPGYVSYVTGLAGDDLQRGSSRGRVLLGSSLFVAGFTAVFATITFAASSVVLTIFSSEEWLMRISGVLIIGLGLIFMGAVPGGRTLQLKQRPSTGLVGAPLFGAVFALSWAPCFSPMLAAITAMSWTQGGTGRGVALIIIYSFALGLPFIVFAVGMRHLMGVFHFFRRHSQKIAAAGGVMLILLGILMVSGAWMHFANWLRATVGTGAVGI